MTGRGEAYRGVGPEGAFAAMAAGGTRGACVLTEVVVAGDGLPAEVAHEAPAPARHSVAALRLDQARPALDALPHTSCRHALLAAVQKKKIFDEEGSARRRESTTNEERSVKTSQRGTSQYQKHSRLGGCTWSHSLPPLYLQAFLN